MTEREALAYMTGGAVVALCFLLPFFVDAFVLWRARRRFARECRCGHRAADHLDDVGVCLDSFCPCRGFEAER